MRHGSDLIDMPVVIAGKGEEIERVKGLVLDHSQMNVAALLIDDGGLFRQARILPLCDVRSFGRTGIAVSSPTVIRAADQVPDIRLRLHRPAPVAGTKMMTDDGTEVGTVQDVLFDERTGHIDAFEISKEAWTSTIFGHSALPLHEEIEHGVIVQASKIKELSERQDGAIKSTETSSDEASARTSHEDVPRVEKGLVNAEQSLETAGEYLRQGTHLVQDFAGELWEAAKHKALSIREQASLIIEKHRIQRALGHRVSRAILDNDEEIIIDKGEVITHLKVEDAREAGVLEALLDAVDRTVPEATTTSENECTGSEGGGGHMPLP